VILHPGDEGISMEVPTPVFIEISEIWSELMQSLKELKLGDLMLNVNRYLFLIVLCPCGGALSFHTRWSCFHWMWCFLGIYY
jgi:hypothetical protein